MLRLNIPIKTHIFQSPYFEIRIGINTKIKHQLIREGAF